MQRFHLHLHVRDLAASVAFYSRLLGQEPTRQYKDYAQWKLDHPALNLALSQGDEAGPSSLHHLGIQADSTEELAELSQRAQQASADLVSQHAHCCYAESEKHWVFDPDGRAWEHFLTLAVDPGRDTPNPTASPFDPVSSTPAACCGNSPSAACNKQACIPKRP